jgi:stage II sporulation protein AA (anti-sigma F factor antagonist)
LDPLRIEEKPRGAAVALVLSGELDLASADGLTARLAELREEDRAVVLDLDALEFIDSCGLRVILQAAAASRGCGWSFRVTRGSADVARVFEATGVLDRLPLVEGEA